MATNGNFFNPFKITYTNADKNIINNNRLDVLYKGKEPIFSDGRAAQKYLIFKILKYLLYIPAQIPILNELFLSKINWAIKKK